MELTGPRRFIHTTLFATVAWAGYLILFMWSWDGGIGIEYYVSPGEPGFHFFRAGTGICIILGFAAVVIAGRAMQRATLERGSRASVLLLALAGLAWLEGAVQSMLRNADSLVSVAHFDTHDVVRTAVWLIPTAGLVLLAAVRWLTRWERHQHELVCGPG